MKTLQSVRLTKTEGSSDKEYSIFLVEDKNQYFVNFQYGRRNATQRPGTKTKEAVTKEEAEKIYAKILKEQLRDGYVADGATANAIVSLAVEVKAKDALKVWLLEELTTEAELEKYLKDPSYVAQKKNDGERRSVNKTAEACVGGNKKAEVVGVPQEIIDGLAKESDVHVDSEIIGTMLHVFDVVRHKGQDLSNHTYENRLKVLDKLKVSGNVVIVETAFTTAEKRAMLKKLREENAEGIVFKKKDALYTAGRNDSALKYKFYKTLTVKVSALTKGKRSVQMSVLDNGVFVDVGAVTVPANKEIPKVNDFIEVRYLYAYKGGSLFQPTFLFSRTDVDDSDASIKQIIYKAEEGVEA